MHLWQNNQSHEAAGANKSVGYRTAAAFNCSWQQSSQPHERVGHWAHASLMLIVPLARRTLLKHELKKGGNASLFLTFMVGPAGLLVFTFTRLLLRKQPVR
jgi:hypothetical protein